MLKRIIKSHIFYAMAISLIISHASAKTNNKTRRIPIPHQTSLVVDVKTGKVLHEKNSKIRIYPASLTKLMTLYLAFEAVESGKLSMNQKLRVSRNAEKMRPLKLGLREGEYITTRDAILGTTIRSANDASVVLAETIARSESNFARLMTAKARKLGMKDTKFKNASGWHDPEQKTTARDLAKLAIAIKRDFPKFYPLFSQTSFIFRGNMVNGHNRVTANYDGAEGLKTGYTTPAGYNLITTASRNNKTLVGVVTGGSTWSARDKAMVKLLDKHFAQHNQINPSIKSKKYSKLASNTYIKNKKKNRFPVL